jgi:hypothetical protein
MSFALTEKQILDRTKTQTRRLGWLFVKAGDLIQPIEKGQGLKKGERVKYLGGPIRVKAVWGERLNTITRADVAREGFPEMGPRQFVKFFCKTNGCARDRLVNVITFEYLDDVAREVAASAGRAKRGKRWTATG